jgi:hypothetical protein
MRALATVKATSESRAYFAWNDLAVTRKLAGYPTQIAQLAKAKPNSLWVNVFGIGMDDLETVEPELTSRTSINVLAADQAIQIGELPNAAARIDGPGIDAASITRSLQGLGAKQVSIGGRTFLAFGAQRSINIDGPLGRFGVGSQLDRSVVEGHTLVAGSAVAPVVALLGGSPSLASDPPYRAAAACLGNVVNAEIATPIALGAVGSAAELVAIGDQQPTSASTPVTEKLCMIDSSAKPASRQVARLNTALAPSGRIPGLGQRSGSLVSSVHVTQSKAGNLTVIRTAFKDRQAGFLDRVDGFGELGALIGGATRSY